MKKLIFPTIAALLTAVSPLHAQAVKEHVNSFKESVYTHKLTSSQSVSFTFDEQTTPYMHGVQYIDDENLLAMRFRDKLIFFDMQSGQQKQKVDIPSSSPAIFSYINRDSIYVNDGDMFVLFDMNGDVHSRHNIRYPKRNMSLPAAKISEILLKDNNLYFTGNVTGESPLENSRNRDVVMCYDLSSSKIRSTMSYSKIYQDHNWGGALFRWVYSAFDNQDNIIVSLPADHNIYINDLEFTEIKEVYAGSSFFSSTNYLDIPKMMPLSKATVDEQFIESGSYANIFYDKYRNCYYRFAEAGVPYTGMSRWKKRLSVIILDDKFNKIGESAIDDYSQTYRYGSFVAPEGLYIPYQSGSNLNYHIYKLSKL